MNKNHTWLKRILIVAAILLAISLLVHSCSTSTTTSGQNENEAVSGDTGGDENGDGDASGDGESGDGDAPSPAVAVCGDNECTGTETHATCPGDCAADCGNGECIGTENASNCEADCPAVCPDGACTHTENAARCPAECPAVCPDGACTPGENEGSCEADCGTHGPDGFLSEPIDIGTSHRSVDFYAPASRGSSPPLVIAFHGTTDPWGHPKTEWITRDGDPSGIRALSNDNGFVVAVPESRLWGEAGCVDWDNHGGWSAYYWETKCNNAPLRGPDPNANEDLLLVKEIIARTRTSYNIDLNRVYLLGFSNGGFFSIHAAMLLRDQIAAFAAMGSGLVLCANTVNCLYGREGVDITFTNCDDILAAVPADSPCRDASGGEKPNEIYLSGRKVPGFVANNNNDDVVSVFYACTLYSVMRERLYTVEPFIGDASGHSYPEGALPAAWRFLSENILTH